MEAPPVRYVTTGDGHSIAYATKGSGRPFVLMPLPFSHIQRYWRDPTFVTPWPKGWAERFRLIQYDGRGQGMSTRGLGDDFRLRDLGLDLEAVVERVQPGRFVLCAVTGICHVAIQFAALNADKVEALILCLPSLSNTSRATALFDTIPGQNWDVFLHSQLPPGLSLEETSFAMERVKSTVTQADYVRLVRGSIASSIEELLPSVRVPTLVLHPRAYRYSDQETSMNLAARIPNSQFVLVDGVTLLGDPAPGLKAMDDFLAALPERAPVQVKAEGAGLSTRELEVLCLVAAGKSNAQIADELVISQNTVIRHVSNIFAKIGAANRAEATSYAHRHGIV
jgi:DNA-binding NarL/FixJ family response regulator